MIRAIIFDFFGLFHTDDYKSWLTRNGLERTGQWQEAAVMHDSDQFGEGEFLEHLSKLSGRTITNDEFYAEAAVNIELIKTARRLHEHYKTALLSNSPSKLIRSLLNEYNLTDIFDEIIISGEVGLVKPDPAIFRLALEKLDIPAADAILIDDNPQYVATAESVGMKGLQFTTNEQLLADLRNLGIDQ